MAFHGSPVPLALLDRSLHVLDANAAFESVRGIECTTAIDDPTDPIRSSVEHVLRTGGTDQVRGTTLVTPASPAASPRTWDITTTALMGPDGETSALLQHVEDVTDVLSEQRAVEASTRTEHDRLVRAIDEAEESLQDRAEQLQALNDELARAGSRDRSVARALQDALLATLPRSSRVQLEARYLSATGTDQVGGDWYDAYVAPDGDVTLTIGDVMGHDIVAAGLMGQLRNLLRALVVDRHETPAELLSRLDRALARLHVDTLATAALLTARPEPGGGWELRWSNAGHPAPLLVTPDGATKVLDGARSTLLGVAPETRRADATRHLPTGSVLLLYTDGLVETREHDIDEGKARLMTSVGHHHRLPPARFLDAVLTDMVGGHPEDDVAVLAVRFATGAGAAGPAPICG